MNASSPDRDLERLLAGGDAAIVDLDQCIYPRFTQTRCGRALLMGALRPRFRPDRPARDLQACRGNLLRGAAYIIGKRAGALLGGRRPGNEELMAAFGTAVAGVPSAELAAIASRLPRLGPQGWREALGELSVRMPVHLVTFSIEPIARAYGEATWRGRQIFSGWKGTPLIYRDGRAVGVRIPPGWLTPEGKLEMLEEILAGKGYRHPLIIGHGRDEALMARRAGELGGGSIGLRRLSCDWSSFDILLGRGAWKTVAKAARSRR